MEGVTRNAARSDEANNLIMAKVVAMSVLGIASFIIGILPTKLPKLFNKKSMEGDKNLTISLLLCFGGGVLLFTTFIHLQPEVRQTFAQLEENGKLPNIGGGIPISELVFCFGFFFVYLIEEMVHLFLNRSHEALQRSLSVRGPKKDDLSIPRVTLNKFDDSQISYITTGNNKEILTSQIGINMEKHQNHHHHHHHDDHHHHHQHSHTHIDVKNSLSGLLAVLALSFHAVFEGLAVGLEGSVQKVWYLFAAIATHKFVIGFCVGVELVSSKTKTLLTILYIGTFAIVTPLGIGIGLILSEPDNSHGDITSSVLQGMAAGTLLYVVFFEVLARERGNQHSGIWQLLSIIAGFAVMYSLQLITGHDHNHSNGSIEHHHGHHHHETI